MEPETKKKIAHVLGWTEVHIIEFLDPLVMGLPPKNTLPLPEEFNPETNDTQLWECVEKLGIDINYIRAGLWQSKKGIMTVYNGRGITPKAAVIAALNEMFGE